jgi:hypothetical protein
VDYPVDIAKLFGVRLWISQLYYYQSDGSIPVKVMQMISTALGRTPRQQLGGGAPRAGNRLARVRLISRMRGVAFPNAVASL